MIFRYQIEQHAENFIDNALSGNKEAIKYLKEPSRWKKWIDLLHIRANEIETWGERKGIRWSRAQIFQFIISATKHYAFRQIDKAEQRIKKNGMS